LLEHSSVVRQVFPRTSLTRAAPVKMGTSASIPLSEGDSIVSPGKPSILSDPIKIDFAAFLNETVAYLKYPVPPPVEVMLKEVKVAEGSSPDDFTVTVILDPAKLKAFGLENKDRPELARIMAFNKVKVNRAERTIETENFKERWEGEEEELQVKSTVCFTKEDHFRLDYHLTLPDGTRKADAEVIASLTPILESIASELAPRKVKLTTDEGSKCYSTGTIDESVAAYDKFFDCVVECLKDGAAASGSTVETMTETKFKIVSPGDGLPYVLVTFDKEKGTILYETTSADGAKKLNTTGYTFVKSPLSLEIASTGESGEKSVGPGMKKFLQILIDNAVKKAAGGGGVFGGLFG